MTNNNGPSPSGKGNKIRRAPWRDELYDGPAQLHTPKQFCRQHQIGLTKFWDELKSGRLQAVRVGTRTMVPEESARAWRAALPPVAHADAGNRMISVAGGSRE